MEAAPTPGGVTAMLVFWMLAHLINFFVPLNLTYVDLVKTVEVRYKGEIAQAIAFETTRRDPETASLNPNPHQHKPSEVPSNLTTVRVHRKIWNPNTILGALLGFFMAWASFFNLVTILYGTLSTIDATDPAVVNAFAERWVILTAVGAVISIILTHHEYRFARAFAIVSTTSAMIVLFAHRRVRGTTTSTFEDVTLALNLFAVGAAAVVIGAILYFVPSLNGPLTTGMGFGSVIGWAADPWANLLWGVLDDYIIALSVGGALVVVTWVYEQCIFKRVAVWMRDHSESVFWNTFWSDVAAHNSG